MQPGPFWFSISIIAGLAKLSAKTGEQFDGILAVYVIQHPDIAGGLVQWQHQTVFRKRDLDQGGYTPGNHQGWGVKGSHAKGFTQRLAFRWIEADTPHIEEAC